MSNGTPPPPPPAGATPPAPPATPPQGAPPQGAPPQGYNPPPSGSTGGSSGSGFPLWAKIGLGCGCLVLIAGIAMVTLLGYGAKKAVDFAQEFEANPSKAVETLIELNPELDVVENDPDSGKITIRNNKTGEQSTFDYSDVQSGNIKFENNEGSFSVNADDESGVTITTPEGEARFGADQNDVPAWVPRYPNAQAQESGAFSMVTNDKAQGMAASTTADSLAEVEAWFTEKLEGEGYQIERNSLSAGGTEQIMLQGKKTGIDQLVVTASRESGATETQVTVAYSGPKQ